MIYDIISSSSSGNSVRIENILIDCGVSYKLIKDVLPEIDYVLITHIHSDHLRRSTVNNIRKKFPNIKILSHYETAELITLDKVLEPHEKYKTPRGFIKGIPVIHDVYNFGYDIKIDDNRIIYSTDLYTARSLPQKAKYDYVFLEANYDADYLTKLSVYHKGYQHIMDSQYSHLSKQESIRYYIKVRRTKDSKYIPLHKSDLYG